MDFTVNLVIHLKINTRSFYSQHGLWIDFIISIHLCWQINTFISLLFTSLTIHTPIVIMCSTYKHTVLSFWQDCWDQLVTSQPVSLTALPSLSTSSILIHLNTLAGVPLMYMIHISSDDGTTDTHINTTSEGYQYVTHDWCPLYTFNITSVNGAGLGGTSAVSLALKNGKTVLYGDQWQYNTQDGVYLLPCSPCVWRTSWLHSLVLILDTNIYSHCLPGKPWMWCILSIVCV